VGDRAEVFCRLGAVDAAIKGRSSTMVPRKIFPDCAAGAREPFLDTSTP